MAARIIPILPQQALAALPDNPAAQLKAPPPLALYIHFPWCVKKCPYCDFNSHAVRDNGIPDAAYVDALLQDLQATLPQVWGRRVISIFIGGGTPSLIPPEQLNRLLTGVRTLLPLDPEAEITLEANPGTVEAGRFAEFRGAGVTRVSLGIQSFDDVQLERLGRIHDSREARAAIELAARNFDTWNIDLMYALPQQTLAQAESDLAQALSFAPPHLSCYHLTLEPNTLFHRAPPPLPDEDASADMQDMMETRLAEAGYRHYETSAFAKPGHRCRHNLNYWSFGDYIGIGAGAHGKLTSHEGVRREMRHKHPNAYLDAARSGNFVQDANFVAAADLPFEFMMNALRLLDGVPRAQLELTTGLPLASIEKELGVARTRGLLEIDADRIRPSEHGRRFLNDLLEIFLAK
ncbi:radical SAM family heme chaperone HemW [Uliginosibacterium sp. H3]|uniref:Heme chaperone HemW n=1 Tax=Uliginosibacterium silvisoli TaxID=3114758 RepID=A0ABU6JY21_9RHOO|nr:radical SAM family heme chaperone HemW [Uliginosibacterium sp. H3]